MHQMTMLLSSPRSRPSDDTVKLRVSPSLAVHRLRSPAESNDSPRTTGSTHSFAQLHQMKLLDPFLLQYIKEPQGDVHELFFQSLQRLITVKNVDYYHKYLNRAATRGKSPDAVRFKNPKMKHLLLEGHVLPNAAHNNDIVNQRQEHAENSPMEGVLPHTSAHDVPQHHGGKTRLSVELPAVCKKLHTQVEMQTLLREFKDCPTGTLIILITRMLQLLINLNDHNVPPAISSPMTADNKQESPASKNKLLTRYHSRTPPAIWIDTYISRLVKFNNLTQANLLLTIYYIDLLSHNFQPYFTLNSWTVHRFLLVATMLAQKALEDFFYTNEHYAKVAGVALTELNCLELDFLSRVNWRVVPAKQLEDGTWSIKHSKEVLDMYYWQLVTLTGKNVTERNNVMYVFGDESSAYASRL